MSWHQTLFIVSPIYIRGLLTLLNIKIIFKCLWAAVSAEHGVPAESVTIEDIELKPGTNKIKHFVNLVPTDIKVKCSILA